MCFSGGGASAPKAPVPVAVEQPIDEAGQKANDALRKRLRALAGYSSTSLTGGQGVTGSANIGKTTLGA